MQKADRQMIDTMRLRRLLTLCSIIATALQLFFVPAANSDAGYMSIVQREIKRAWRPPPLDSARYKAKVRFSINWQGELNDLKIWKKSGSDQFDQSALLAIATASPFSPLPRLAPEKVEIEFTFDEKLLDKKSLTKTAKTKTSSSREIPNILVLSCGPGPKVNPEKITRFSGPCKYQLYNRHDDIFRSSEPKPVAELRIGEDGNAELLLPNKDNLSELSLANLQEHWGSRSPKFDFTDLDSHDFLLNSKRDEKDGSRFLIETVFDEANKLEKYRVTNTYKLDEKNETAGIEQTDWIFVKQKD